MGGDDAVIWDYSTLGPGDDIEGGMKTVDESNPRRFGIPRWATRLVFSNPGDAKVDRTGLTRRITRHKRRKKVTSIDIDWESQMESAWVAALFPKVRKVHIFGKRIRSLDELVALRHLNSLCVDIEGSRRRSLEVLPKLSLDNLNVKVAKDADIPILNRCTRVRRLAVSSWPRKDLSELWSLKLKEFSISSGPLETVAGLDYRRMVSMDLGPCRKLRSVAGARTTRMWIAMCSRVRLETIGEVAGLRDLWLMSQRQLDSFAFLSRCATLEGLTVTATRITATDIRHLIESPSLKEVTLSMMKSRTVEEIGKANPRLLISNSRVCYRHGKPIPIEEAWKYYD